MIMDNLDPQTRARLERNRRQFIGAGAATLVGGGIAIALAAGNELGALLWDLLFWLPVVALVAGVYLTRARWGPRLKPRPARRRATRLDRPTRQRANAPAIEADGAHWVRLAGGQQRRLTPAQMVAEIEHLAPLAALVPALRRDGATLQKQVEQLQSQAGERAQTIESQVEARVQERIGAIVQQRVDEALVPVAQAVAAADRDRDQAKAAARVAQQLAEQLAQQHQQANSALAAQVADLARDLAAERARHGQAGRDALRQSLAFAQAVAASQRRGITHLAGLWREQGGSADTNDADIRAAFSAWAALLPRPIVPSVAPLHRENAAVGTGSGTGRGLNSAPPLNAEQPLADRLNTEQPAVAVLNGAAAPGYALARYDAALAALGQEVRP